METAMAKWIMETHELDDHAILLTLEIEDITTIGVSTQIKEIKEMMETFTKHNHVYQLTGFDEHKYFVCIMRPVVQPIEYGSIFKDRSCDKMKVPHF